MSFRSRIKAFALAGLVATIGTAATATDINAVFSPSSEELRNRLVASSLILQAERDGTKDTQELLAAARADYERLLAVLYDAGHFGGVISITVDGREAANIPPLESPDAINTITLRINMGPIYRFSQANIGPLAAQTELPEEFRRGAIASTGAIRDAARAAVDGWRANGNALADIGGQQITARHDQNRVGANIAVTPGPVLSFGEVSIQGNADVRTRRINTIAGLTPGQRFDPAEIERAERRLRRTGSFRSVVITESETAAPDGTLPLTIEVAEQTPRRFGFGAEYSTIDGVRLTGFWLHRNFLGGAERFRVDSGIAGIGGETGGIDYGVDLRYERPATPRADVDLFAELGFERLKEPDFQSRTGDFTLGFTRYAADDLVVTFGLGYLYSEVEDDFGKETYSLITLPLSATRERRDDLLDPTKGVFFRAEATPFYGLGDTESGAQLKFDARGYRTFGETLPVTAALRLQLGSLVGPSLTESPPFYRFYSGGGGTVRGQDYQSLAVAVNGDRTGGRSFAGISGEARVRVTDTITMVGFYDWGFVAAESFTDGGDTHAGAGLGIRYNTGIGPIRLDLATPISGSADASDFYIYVGIGQAF
ncbi:MAG: BamA/TamA family outer membrane protein [Boseongicola sp.]|nr:BamA/TamA family outer membrane protein [Boseongicola sp.]